MRGWRRTRAGALTGERSRGRLRANQEMRRPTGKAWRYAAASTAAIGAVVLALAFWWAITDTRFGKSE